MSKKIPLPASMDPEVLLAELVEEASDVRRVRSLNAVHEALETMRKQGAANFTVAATARTIEALGLNGPKEQSIRNKSGEHYRLLIDAYERAYGEQLSDGSVEEVPELVAAIPDQKVRARVQMLFAENKTLKRRVDLLHKGFRELQPLDSLAEEQGSEKALPSSTDTRLSETERWAVKRFVDGDLEEFGLQEDDSGAVLHANSGLELAPPGFMAALRKVAEPKGVIRD